AVRHAARRRRGEPAAGLSHAVAPHVHLHSAGPSLPRREPADRRRLVHEIKHDGYRMMVRRDASGVRLLTRNGKDWAGRFPTIVQAAAGLKARSCLIDGEAVCCDENGLAVFALLRYREQPAATFLYAFDLLDFHTQHLPPDP